VKDRKEVFRGGGKGVPRARPGNVGEKRLMVEARACAGSSPEPANTHHDRERGQEEKTVEKEKNKWLGDPGEAGENPFKGKW